MDLEERIKIGNLAEYYGKLLTDKQYEILMLYVNQNLSFSEISESLNISKQAVKDAVDKAIFALNDYENKLGCVARDVKIKDFLNCATSSQIDDLTKLQIISILEDK